MRCFAGTDFFTRKQVFFFQTHHKCLSLGRAFLPFHQAVLNLFCKEIGMSLQVNCSILVSLWTDRMMAVTFFEIHWIYQNFHIGGGVFVMPRLAVKKN